MANKVVFAGIHIRSGQPIVSSGQRAMIRKVKFWSWKKPSPPTNATLQPKPDSAEQRHAMEVARIQRWLELADSALKSSKKSAA